MQSGLDWLSFTLDIVTEPTTALSADQMWRARLKREHPELYKFMVGEGHQFEYRTGRPPYRYGFQRDDNAVLVMVGSNTSTMLVELTGRFFTTLKRLEQIQNMLLPIADFVTRIDVAVDMETTARPAEFANTRKKAKTISLGFMSSPTGETVYLGSQKSDRFARIYRYEEPHPRAKLLRFEAVYRRGYAKSLAKTILEATAWDQVTVSVEKPYGFQHEAWKPGSETPLKISLPHTSREEDRTIVWLYNTVAPALCRMIQSGALDVDAWNRHLQTLASDGVVSESEVE